MSESVLLMFLKIGKFYKCPCKFKVNGKPAILVGIYIKKYTCYEDKFEP